MKLVEHFFESRPFAPGEAKVVYTGDIRGLVVVVGRLVGPNGPWDYFVATYFRDGTRVGTGAWQGPDHVRAMDHMFAFVENWRDRAEEARALVEAHEAARAA